MVKFAPNCDSSKCLKKIHHGKLIIHPKQTYHDTITNL